MLDKTKEERAKETIDALRIRNRKKIRLNALMSDEAMSTSKKNKKLLTGVADGYSKTEHPVSLDGETKNIENTTNLYLGLNSSSNFFLGEKISISVLTGMDINVSLSVLEKEDERNSILLSEGYDFNNPENTVPMARSRISFTGIAKSVEIGVETLDVTALAATLDKDVLMPSLKKLELAYGNINTTDSDRILGVEFIDPGESSDAIDLDKCSYGNFRWITKEGDIPEFRTFPTLGSVKSDEPAFEKYIANKDNLFNGYHAVKIPDSMGEDSEFLNARERGVNIINYQHGRGRIAYENMDGISKSVTFAKNQYSNIYCKGAKFTVVCAPHTTEAIYTLNTTNNHVRVFNTSIVCHAMDVTTTLQAVKITPSVVGFDMSSSVGTKLVTFKGAEIEKSDGIKLQNNVIGIMKSATEIGSLNFRFNDIHLHAEQGEIGVMRVKTYLSSKSFELDDVSTSVSRHDISMIV